MNRATLVGNVGRDPEIRNTSGGKSMASFSLATSERWKNGSGEQQELTEWHRIVVFNEALIRVIQQYVHKGSKLLVEGRIQHRDYQDKDGVDRKIDEVVLGSFDCRLLLLGGKEETASAKPSERRSAAEELDDEIPF